MTTCIHTVCMSCILTNQLSIWMLQQEYCVSEIGLRHLPWCNWLINQQTHLSHFNNQHKIHNYVIISIHHEFHA